MSDALYFSAAHLKKELLMTQRLDGSGVHLGLAPYKLRFISSIRQSRAVEEIRQQNLPIRGGEFVSLSLTICQLKHVRIMPRGAPSAMFFPPMVPVNERCV
jgi:hypothetical protein